MKWLKKEIKSYFLKKINKKNKKDLQLNKK